MYLKGAVLIYTGPVKPGRRYDIIDHQGTLLKFRYNSKILEGNYTDEEIKSYIEKYWWKIIFPFKNYSKLCL